MAEHDPITTSTVRCPGGRRALTLYPDDVGRTVECTACATRHRTFSRPVLRACATGGGALQTPRSVPTALAVKWQERTQVRIPFRATGSGCTLLDHGDRP
jgi:hypothetical protein